MSNIEVEIDTKEFKDKLGIKDVDMTPILESIFSLKKELKKTPTSNNKEVLDAIKLITNNKSDNSDIISAIDKMASKIVIPEGNKDLILRFDKLVDSLNSQGLFRPNYNSYNPQIRNKEGVEINPSTEEKQDTIISHIDGVETKLDTIISDVDNVETLLGNIETNQTDRTQETKIFDSWGDEIGSTMIDEMMVSEKNRIAGGVFNGTTPDTNFYTTVLNANGTATISNSILDVKVTADSGSSSMVYTNSLGRYIGGNMGHLRGIFRPGDTGVAGNTRMIGLTYGADLADSIYFQLSGTTFSIVANTTGLAQIKIDNGSFNGDATTYPITNVFRTWEILYTNKRIQFFIDKVLIHTLTETTFPICGTRHLRPFIKNINTGVVSETHLYCQSLTLFTWGNSKTQPKIHYHEGQTTGILLKTGIGSLHEMVVSGVVNNANVDLYDGISTAGTKIWSSGAMSNQTIPFSIPFNNGIIFQNGLYLVKSGANCNTQTIYE